MTSVSVLIDIPSHLIGTIVFEWLEILDLVTFDSSLCRVDLRESFLCHFKFSNVLVLIGPYKMTPSSLQWLINRHAGVSGAIIPSNFSSIISTDVDRLFENITFLEVSEATVTDIEVLLKMSMYCLKLQKIRLSHSVFVTDALLDSFHANCGDLRAINVEETNVTDAAMIPIMNDRVTSLNVSSCSGVTNMLLNHIATNCPQLTALHMNDHRLSVALLETICRGCPRLTALSNAGNSQLIDEGLAAITLHCPLIRVLDFSYCINLTDVAVQDMLEEREGYVCVIEEIRLSCCFALTDATLNAIAMSCPKLTTLDVSDCSAISDSGLLFLLQCCCEIKDLTLQDCENISDDTLRHISSHCPLLERLNVTHCEGCTDMTLLTGCPLLQTVLIDSNPHLTDDDLTRLVTHCSRMKRLDFSECVSLTDIAVTFIAERCGPYLEELHLRGCVNLTQTSLHAILNHCKQLRILDIRECSSVYLTPLSVLCIAAVFRRLKTLGVSMDLSSDGEHKHAYHSLMKVRPALRLVGDDIDMKR